MFSRWCQENFFGYMMEHYDIDGLVEYGAESLPGTLLTINPTWRELDKQVKKSTSSREETSGRTDQTHPDGQRGYSEKSRIRRSTSDRAD
ncbi:putative transposase [Ferrovum myxofaciens]|uniref:putative transposase n=1 Tax=Ferrovum myxofaciens TaxID=416213 RepID=UPI003B5C54EB